MGLESINFYFHADDDVEAMLKHDKSILAKEENKYVIYEENRFLIDLKSISPQELSIRITLCNPRSDVLNALKELLSKLFKLTHPALKSMNSKEIFREINEDLFIRLDKIFDKAHEVFKTMYGDYTAAISADDLDSSHRI